MTESKNAKKNKNRQINYKFAINLREKIQMLQIMKYIPRNTPHFVSTTHRWRRRLPQVSPLVVALATLKEKKKTIVHHGMVTLSQTTTMTTTFWRKRRQMGTRRFLLLLPPAPLPPRIWGIILIFSASFFFPSNFEHKWTGSP